LEETWEASVSTTTGELIWKQGENGDLLQYREQKSMEAQGNGGGKSSRRVELGKKTGEKGSEVKGP